MDTVLQKNLSLLARRNPEAAARVAGAADDPALTYVSTAGRKPTATCTRSGAATPILLHSKYDPEREAVKLVEGYKLNLTMNVVVLGLGLGYHVLQLFSKKTNRDFIVICEANPALVKMAFSCFDFGPVIENPAVMWFIGEQPEQVIEQVRKTQSMSVIANGLAIIVHPPSVQLYGGYYVAIKKSFEEFITYAKVNMSTHMERMHTFMENALQNAEEYVRARPVADLFGIAAGHPAFIVGAGPSLDRTIGQLRLVKGRGVIIAVDSALRGLLAHGIVPDIVMSIDFTPHTLKYFNGIDTRELALVFDSEINPVLLRTFKGTKYAIHLPNKSISEWFTAVVGNKGAIDKGLSVSHAGALLAEKMGASPLVLVGQDLAYPRSQWHAKGSSYFQTLDVTDRSRLHLRETTDTFGGVVTTSVALMVFKSHFEGLINEHGLDCYNASEGGAVIRGAKVIALRDAIVRFCRSAWQMPAEELRTDNSDSDLEMLVAAAEQTVAKLTAFHDGATEVCALLREAEKQYDDEKNRGAVKQTFLSVQRLSRELEKDRRLLDLLRDLSTEAMLIRQRRNPDGLTNLSETTDEKIIDFVRTEFNFYRVLVQAAEVLKKEMAALVERNADLMVGA